MKRETNTRFGFILVLGVLLLSGMALGQAGGIQPAQLDQPMPAFTLPNYMGGDIALADLQGKNVMLIFPRGLAGENHWCHICNYQYAELVELEQKKSIREKYNLEIIFVLPYGKEMIDQWMDAFPAQFTDIENWKKLDASDEGSKRRRAFAIRAFPKSYQFEKGSVPTPFPILVDEDRTVSKGLDLFRTEWGNSQIEQNIPTVYLLDKKGVVRFKYLGQNTFDRPGPEYLLKFIEQMIQ